MQRRNQMEKWHLILIDTHGLSEQGQQCLTALQSFGLDTDLINIDDCGLPETQIFAYGTENDIAHFYDSQCP